MGVENKNMTCLGEDPRESKRILFGLVCFVDPVVLWGFALLLSILL